MKIDKKILKEALLKGGYVASKDFSDAEKFTKTNNVPIERYLLDKNLITKDAIGQALAEIYKVPYADLNSIIPFRDQILKIPKEPAEKYRMVLFEDKGKDIIITTDNPSKKGIKNRIKQIFPKSKCQISFSLPEDIDQMLLNYRKALEARFVKIIKKQKRIAPEIIEEILKDALTYRASDIHFEPREKEAVVRFRIDGVLSEVGRIPKEYYENIINRIKIQAHLRIDEHYATQDGAIRFAKDNIKIDLRVSISPTIDGEKVTIRILSEYVRDFSLEELGLNTDDQQKISKSVKKPFGMILVTGPTGSGKTTTLYSILKKLNTPDVNITTIEDPVEYKMTGVNQIQVNTQTNLTFSKGLRSIVRQDPDIILVGEIRDKETAEIAVNAALTGHLLFSTFHANDASTAVPRLLDMDIEPFLLSSTLEVVVAQRLARKICDNCRYSVNYSRKELDKMIPNSTKYFNRNNMYLYRSKGCEACNHSGYKGRIAIFEIIFITPEMQNLILQHPSAQEIWKLAKKQGARSLFDDGLDKVKSGVTSLEELLRIASPSEY